VTFKVGRVFHLRHDRFDLRGAFNDSFVAEMPAHESPLLNVDEAAEYIHRNKVWVYRVLRYKVPVVKLGQQVFFEKRELDALIANHREVPAR
jgi:hypothetical protein